REAPRGQPDGHRGDQGGEQRHQRQEALRPLERDTQLGATVLEGLDAPGPIAPGPEGRLEGAHPGRVARDQQAPAHPARRLHQSGGLEVLEADHGPRREVDEIGAAVGLDRDQPRHREGGLT
ncbi:MAG: hypothetical protein ACK56I_18650, partial [bacterium]